MSHGWLYTLFVWAPKFFITELFRRSEKVTVEYQDGTIQEVEY